MSSSYEALLLATRPDVDTQAMLQAGERFSIRPTRAVENAHERRVVHADGARDCAKRSLADGSSKPNRDLSAYFPNGIGGRHFWPGGGSEFDRSLPARPRHKFSVGAQSLVGGHK